MFKCYYIKIAVLLINCCDKSVGQISLLPLGWRPIHNDVDPEDLHGIQRVGEVHKRCQGDESEGSNAPNGRDHFVSILLNIHTHIHIHTHTYTHIYIHTYIYTHTHIHIHTYTYIYICTHIHTIHIHIYIHIHTYTLLVKPHQTGDISY